MATSKYIFLLAGKTGVGKSALGNAILGKDMFKSEDSPDSVTENISVKSADRRGFHITVVDTPGFMGTQLHADESKLQACEDMKKAMQVCPAHFSGKLAVIFVIKFGERFTEENKNTLYILENIFGKKNVWKSCIIVMTYGDNFDSAYENTYFLDYLKKQNGEFGELFKKCNYMCVLFHNKTKNGEQQKKQFEMLMNCVSNLDQGFTRRKFEDAVKEQNRLQLEANLPSLKEEFQKSIHDLTCSINEIQFNSETFGKLEVVEHRIRQQLFCANERDSTETIYYEANEPRLLEDIKCLLEELLQLNVKKKEDFRQMQFYQNVQKEIEEIKTEIMQTDPRHQAIFVSIGRLEEKISQEFLVLKCNNLRFEFAYSLNTSLNSARKELDNLKLRAQQAEESEIKEKKEDIIQRLNNVRTHDRDATEHLNKLQNDLETLMDNFENEHMFIEKQFVKSMRSSLTTILLEVKDKKEAVKQFQTADNIKNHIDNIKKDIFMIDPNNQGIRGTISDVDEKLQSLKTLVEKEKLTKEYTITLNESLHEVHKMFQTLKDQVHERKETEIKTLLNYIKERVNKIDCQNGDASTKLSQASIDSQSLLCKLDQEGDTISKHRFLMIKLELKQIEKDIKCKEQQIRSAKIKSEFEEIKQKLCQIDEASETFEEKLNQIKRYLTELESRLNKEELSEDVKDYFNLSLNSLYADFNDKQERAKQTTIARNINKEILDLINLIHETDINQKVNFAIILDFEEKLLALDQTIKKEILHDAIKENLLSAKENVVKMFIKLKVEMINNIQSEIKNILNDISQAKSNDSNIQETFSKIDKQIKLLESRIIEPFEEQYNKCRNSFTQLVSRIVSFQETNKEIDLLVNRVNILGITCRAYHFNGFLTDVERIRNDLREKIRDRHDFDILSGRIKRLMEAIERKWKNNKKKLAGKALRFVPLFGPIIEDTITAGIAQEEKKLFISLSK